MDKIDKLIDIAKKKLEYKPEYNFFKLTTAELKELAYGEPRVLRITELINKMR